MEQRPANSLRLTVNEKKFIETALLSDLRIDGRRPFDYRNLTINFGKHDGSAEVQLGQTHVMAFVTAQLTQPYRDRPNEGSLSIFTEFSPMADPSFEPGRPGQAAVELGRVVDRGLRESRAVDTESLCVLSGKSVWAIRIDLHILDNGGNLVDAANVAALAALLTFRRPECSLGGENGQEVVVHPPEEREPLPLIIHHLPIAVTFAFFGSESSVAIDPTHHEEAVMGGRMTTTLNANGDICAIQKAGGDGILQSVIMQCLRIASVKAGDITEKLKKAVDSYNTERALKKIKRHPSLTPMDVDGAHSDSREKQSPPVLKKATSEFPSHHTRKSNKLENVEGETNSSEQRNTTKNFIGGPSSWDPYSKGVDPDFLKASLASRGSTAISQIREKFYMLCFYDYLIYLNKCSWFFSKRKTFLFDLVLYREHAGASTASKKQEISKNEKMHGVAKLEETTEDVNEGFLQVEAAQAEQPRRGEKTLKDAVKPKNKRKQKESSTGAS